MNAQPQLADLFVIMVNGVPIPLLTLGVGLLCFGIARPLTPRGDNPLSLWLQLLVTALLMLLDAVWIVDHRPAVLIAGIVSGALGFAGFSIIELASDELKSTIRSFGGRIRNLINPEGGSSE